MSSLELKQRSDSGKITLVFFMFIIVLLGLGSIYVGWIELGQGVLERNPPTMEIQNRKDISGIGLNPQEIVINLSDSGMGLDEVVIRAEQKRERYDLVREKLAGQKEHTYKLTLGGTENPFDEGEVSIEIRVFDRSFWSNSTEETLTMLVDKRRPRLSVLTTQHNAQEGGAQLVFYKTSDRNLKSSGVKVGTKRFYGFRANLIDPEIRDPDAYAAMYVVPPRSNINEKDIKVFSEDVVGNLTTRTFYNKIFKRKYRSANVIISDSFVAEKLSSLVEPHKIELKDIDSDMPSAKFKLLNEVIRKKERARITAIIKSVQLSKRSWSGNFMMAAGSPAFRFGEELSYNYKGESWGSNISDGFFLQHTLAQNIFPGQEGVVIFSESLSAHGKTIVIDHGLGVSSIYAGLGSVLTKRGERVRPERPIATVGDTGLFFRPGYYFEINIQGEPTTPLEWWDREWVKSHIENKTKQIKRILGNQEFGDLE